MQPRQYFHRQLPYDLDFVSRLQPRLRSARKLLESGSVQLLAETTSSNHARYAVRSSGVTHTVQLTDDSFKCTCPWFGKHGVRRGPCKHVLAAYVKLQARIRRGLIESHRPESYPEPIRSAPVLFPRKVCLDDRGPLGARDTAPEAEVGTADPGLFSGHARIQTTEFLEALCAWYKRQLKAQRENMWNESSSGGITFNSSELLPVAVLAAYCCCPFEVVKTGGWLTRIDIDLIHQALSDRRPQWASQWLAHYGAIRSVRRLGSAAFN